MGRYRYEQVQNWPQWRGRRTWPLLAPMPATPIAENTVEELDSNGIRCNSRGSGLFVMPIICFDSTGKLLARMGRSGNDNGPVCWYHDVAVDREGSMYVGDIPGNRIRKFIRVKQ